MQEIRNNCFGSKIRSMTLRKVKAGKHECRNALSISSEIGTSAEVRCCYISALVLTCFRLTKGRATYFRSETLVSFLHLMVQLFKVSIITHGCLWNSGIMLVIQGKERLMSWKLHLFVCQSDWLISVYLKESRSSLFDQ